MDEDKSTGPMPEVEPNGVPIAEPTPEELTPTEGVPVGE